MADLNPVRGWRGACSTVDRPVREQASPLPDEALRLDVMRGPNGNNGYEQACPPEDPKTASRILPHRLRSGNSAQST